MNKFLSTVIACFFSIVSFSQNGETSNSLDIMKSNGKIYVVVAVVLVILIGLFIYVWRLDKKITTLEQNKKI